MGAELLRRLQAPFDPLVENVEGFEGRVQRAAAVLERRGLSFDEGPVRQNILKARYVAEVHGMAPDDAVRVLRRHLAGVLESEDVDSVQAAARADALVALIGERTGGAPGGLLARILGTDSSGQQSAATPLATPERPGPGRGDPAPPAEPPRAGGVELPPGLASEAPAAPSGRQLPPPPAAEAGEGSVAQALLALVQAQKEERRAREVRAAAGAGGEQKSTITVRPNLQWPSLGDDDHDVEDFVYACEETVGLSNNCKGMNAREQLRVLHS